MNLDALSELGKIAGIAGIAIGALVLIFNSVIRKKIFPNLTRDQGYKVIRMVVLFAGVLALIGIAAWVFLDIKKNDREAESRLRSKYVIGQVLTEEGAPIISANIEVSQDDSFLDKSDGNGRFALEIKGMGKKYYDVVVRHKSFKTARQKVKIDFEDEAEEISLSEAIVMVNAFPPPQEQEQSLSGNAEPEIGNIPTKVVTTDPPENQVVSENMPAVSTITFNYMGDMLGCNLELYINVGGKVINPSSNTYRVSGVPSGAQNYNISGAIDCGYGGNCNASGNGFINVVSNANYYIMWNMYTCEVGVYSQQDYNRLSGI